VAFSDLASKSEHISVLVAKARLSVPGLRVSLSRVPTKKQAPALPERRYSIPPRFTAHIDFGAAGAVAFTIQAVAGPCDCNLPAPYSSRSDPMRAGK
jgi:hypothetical protein